MKTNRTYQTTHPWLTFRVDLSHADHELWIDLGAIQSKCEHVANVMLPPEISRELLVVYLAKGVHATTAIEGNTLSEEEVLDRIRGQRGLPPSKEYQGVEVDNIVEACNKIQQRVFGESTTRITPETIFEYNAMVLKGLSLPDDVVPGRISQHPVGVGTYRGAPREDCEHLLERLCEWVNDGIVPPSPKQTIQFGVIRAVMAHLYLEWIHPFGDGNGRTGRLVELHLLLASDVPNVAAHLLSNHYNQTRTEYYRQLDYASKSGGDVIRFLKYAARGLVDGLDEAISRIRDYQLEVSWRDYVYARFRDQRGPAAERKRELALRLWYEGPEGVRTQKIPLLSPELSALYAHKTLKTLTRDLNALEEMGLVERHGQRSVRANGGALFAFRPRRLSEMK